MFSGECAMKFCSESNRRKLGACVWMLVAACTGGMLAGCSVDSLEPRYQVSGKVTYAGKPLASGLVKVLPDVANGGIGPGSYAPVKDGIYRTEEGVCAGPKIIKICGFDGVPVEVVKDGQTVMEQARLFDEYPMQAEVHDEDTVIDFDVPQL